VRCLAIKLVCETNDLWSVIVGAGGVRMQSATICFQDTDSGDEALAIVRVIGASVGLALSLRRNGDLEVFLGARELDQLIEALQTARASLSDAEPLA